jgi:hypothetical protein
MGRAKLGSTDVLEGAYFWRMPPDGHCPCEVVGTSVGRAKLGSTDVLGGALKDHGHGAHLAVTPSHAGTQGSMHWSLLHGLGLPTRVGPEQSCVGDGIAWKFTAAAT